ncbi:MAG: AsmA family protein [Hyphomicrobiales bacterium]|nr:AsmA family protein [Hyphomicrobiales bacterium]
MKRFYIALSAAAILVAGIAIAAPFLISTDLVKRRVAEQITEWTGRGVSLRGEPVISLFPYLTVKLKDVTVVGAGGFADAPLIKTNYLKASIRLLPLLIGRVELAEFTMVSPEITLIVDENGRTNWSLDQGSVAKRLEKGAEDDGDAIDLGDIALGTFIIFDGRLTYEDRRTGRHETIEAINFDIDWPSTSRAMSAAGLFHYRGEPVSLNATVNSPAEFLANKPADFRLQLSAGPLRLALDGSANQVSDLQFDGAFSASTPSLRGLITFLGTDIAPGSTLGPMSVKGTANAFGGTISLADATVELDGNIAEGVLTLALAGERPAVQGTLALDRLDLSAYTDTLLKTIAATEPSWHRYVITEDVLKSVDLDVRLSAGRVLLGSLEFGGTALSTLLRDGRLEMEIGETMLYGGRMEGAIRIGSDTDPTLVGAKINAREIDLEALLADVSENKIVQGKADIDLEFKGSNVDLGGLLHAAAGAARIEARSGALIGIDIARIASDKVEKSGDSAELGGKTAFRSMTANVEIAGGQLRTKDFKLVGTSVEVDLNGAANVATRQFDAAGTVRIFDQDVGDDRLPLLEMPFTVRGPLLAPVLVPDFDKLLKRSNFTGVPRRYSAAFLRNPL